MFPLHPPHVWNLIELDIVEAVSTVEGVFGLGQADHQGLRGPGVDWNLIGWVWINFEPRFSEFPRISSFFTHNHYPSVGRFCCQFSRKCLVLIIPNVGICGVSGYRVTHQDDH